MKNNSIFSELKDMGLELDSLGFFKQSDQINNVLIRISQEKKSGYVWEKDGKLYWRYDDKDYLIPSTGKDFKTEIDDKEYKLLFDVENKKFFWYNEKSKKSFLIDDNGKIYDPRSKRYDFLKAMGLRRILGDWRLPNLNKMIPLEPFFRKEFVPLVAKPLRNLGDEARPIGRAITTPLGDLGEQVGIKSIGRPSDEQKSMELKFEKSPDRETKTVKQPSKILKTKIPFKTPHYIRDIKTSDDLLFWAMILSLKLSYDLYDPNDERLYYNEENKNTILSYLNKMAESKSIIRQNSKIPSLLSGAIQILNQKIQQYSPEQTPNIETSPITTDETKTEFSNPMSDESKKSEEPLTHDWRDFGSNIP